MPRSPTDAFRDRSTTGLARSGWVVASLALAGCANLEPVRDFGKSAATLATFPVAGQSYRDSAIAS